MKKKILAAFFAVIILATAGFAAIPTLALTDSEVPTPSYTYWLGYKEKKLVYTRPIYDYETTINGKTLGYSDFSKPTDVYCATNGNTYILEQNSRITKIDNDGKLLKTITGFTDDAGTAYSFVGAEGIFVANNNNIYVADTKNARILIGNEDGKLIKLCGLPESDLIPSDFLYTPTKVAVDSKGYMYVVSSGSTYGALLFDETGAFDGFYGANTVKTTIASFFATVWSKFIASDEQLSAQVQKIPYLFTDLCVDDLDFIYTVTGRTDDTAATATSQIRCLNPKGSNILTVKDSNKYVNTSDFNFGDIELADQKLGSGKRLQNFTSLEVDNGFIYALDNTYGRIYIYDSECNLIATLGGGNGEGTQKGTFVTPNAIAVSGERIYVTDDTANSVTVFRLNDYGKLLKQADLLYIAGDYAGAKPLWEKVNKYDPNCQLAYWGLAKANLIDENYDLALDYAKKGLDYNTYNQAYSYVRNDSIKNAFVPIIIIAAVLVAALIAFMIIKKKRNLKLKVNPNIKTALTCYLKPFEFGNAVKFRGQGSVLIGCVVLLLYYAFEVLGNTSGGFLFSRVDLDKYNALYTLIGSVGIILLWVICYWAVSVLFSGKCRLKEVFIVSSYAMIPQLFNGILYLICSNVLLLEESTIISVISIVTLILSGIVICIGLMICSEYSFFKFAGVTVVAVLGMLVVIFIIFMVLTLDQQLLTFIQSIFKEIAYR